MGAPAYPDVHAQAGSVSEPLEVVFDDVRYTAVGFRSEAGLICSALVDPASERAQGGVGCAGERSLRRGLDEQPFFVSGGGGGGHMIANGFARADVVSMSLASGGDRAVIELSKPWRPLTRATPIRFFYVITDAPSKVRPRSPLLPPGIRIEARLADGRVIRGLR